VEDNKKWTQWGMKIRPYKPASMIKKKIPPLSPFVPQNLGRNHYLRVFLLQRKYKDSIKPTNKKLKFQENNKK